MAYYRRYRRYTNYKKKIKPKKVELTDLEKLGYGEMWEELLKKCDLTCPKCKFKNNPSYINSKDISIHTQYKYKGISLNIDKYGLYGLCTKCNNKFTFKVDIDVSKDHVVSALDEGINNFNKEISFLKKNYQEILSTREKKTHKYTKLVAPYREEETIEKNAVNKETKELRMTMKEYDEWKKDNPDWDKDWSQGCAGQSTEFKWTGEAKSNGRNEVLDRASRQPGANVSKNRYYG